MDYNNEYDEHDGNWSFGQNPYNDYEDYEDDWDDDEFEEDDE